MKYHNYFEWINWYKELFEPVLSNNDFEEFLLKSYDSSITTIKWKKTYMFDLHDVS